MICQTNDPATLIETLASLISKDGSDFYDALVFVPTRRAGRKLERILAEKSGGAAMMPKIVGLGEGDEEAADEDFVGNTERKVVLAKLVMSVADNVGVKSGFSGALAVAGELTTLADYLENEDLDARKIDWPALVPDARKAAFMNTISALDFGRPTATEARNRGIRSWGGKLGNYSRVFCAGSTASVKPTRDLMQKISEMPNGYVVLPGLLQNFDDMGRADPYWSIKQFLNGRRPETIDAGGNKIGFFNSCFDNDLSGKKPVAPDNIVRVDCDTESEEANVAAAVSAMAKAAGEKVLIITPDSAGGQRIESALSRRGLSMDSSGGASVARTEIGRLALLVFDYVLGAEKKEVVAADISKLADAARLGDLKYSGSLFDFIMGAFEKLDYRTSEAGEARAFFDVVSELSEIAGKYELDAESVRELLDDSLRKASVRAPMMQDPDVAILGTAEARMQTADVVVLTGLNEGMFPGDGFRHSWLPGNIAGKIGLPSPDSKVSLMALDFMTLSSGKKVYWTRSRMSGGSETVPSRFLSRVSVRADVRRGPDILAAVRAMDDVPYAPLDSTPPAAKYNKEYYATWLEDLIHNPYRFYAKRILRLRRNPDIGDDAGAREFGTLVHDVLRRAAENGVKSEAEISAMLNAGALKYIGKENLLLRFWQNRFGGIARAVSELLNSGAAATAEEKIETTYLGRRLLAVADRIEEGRRAIDYKTGTVPSDSQLGLGKDANCTMPQLPLEAMILRDRGARGAEMAFLSLGKNRAGLVEYDPEQTTRAIAAVESKLKVILNMEKYERPEYVDEKYADFDDLCRAGD
ncbi:MAG: PD-(D/E)XK nuclease family protein [Rickettsiales bacterium]|jgi:inactivated superfamily I helicase/RecB family exonuclease|nr:PD-(D/E)XK nuclease family protein [Rickettsiales bacterium]